MDIPLLDQINLNPFKYRHDEFTSNFIDLTHMEKLKGTQYKSYHMDDNVFYILEDIDEVNKKLTIRFKDVDSYFIERTCNSLFNHFGIDDLMEEEFTHFDLSMIENNKEGVGLRSWHKDGFGLHLSIVDKNVAFIVVETRLDA